MLYFRPAIDPFNVSTPLPSSQFPIVGIGASAGGLEAISSFLEQLPKQPGCAFVVVQHLERDRASLLAGLLQRNCLLPVTEIVDGLIVEADRVYVIPPSRSLVLRNGALHLHEVSQDGSRFQLIDRFFFSLADDRQDRCVGVILSGTGSDGTLGMEAIREQSGLTAAQDPSTATFSEMPQRVISGGLADIVASADQLPQLIATALKELPPGNVSALGQSDPDGTLLAHAQRLLYQHTGQDFSLYKRNTLYRRLERRMGLTRQPTLQSYLQMMQYHPEEATALLKELLISVTRFFRDTEVWDRVRDEVFPALFACHQNGETLRAWVPGSATGEEAYTLAMVFCEALDKQEPARDISLQIFATDLNQRAIAAARKGQYPAGIVDDVSLERRQRFFSESGNGYQINKKIRDMVIFAPHNLLADPPFSRLDLLSCRNLLIYLAPDVHASLLGHFHYSMNSDSYLLLGSSESIGGATSLFTPLAGCGQLYRRLDGPKQEKRFDFLNRNSAIPLLSPIVGLPHPMKPTLSVDLKAVSERFLLQHCTPTTVLTTLDGDILHLSGKPDRYLQLSEGRAHLNITSMVRDELRATLSEAFQDARELNQPVRLAGPQVAIGDTQAVVSVCVWPLHEPSLPQGMMAVIFESTESATMDTDEDQQDRSQRQSSRLLMLEQMLRQTRDALQVTREEMQTSREELTSTNEELQSTNEELTTSAEELRTMNEELVRARAESDLALSRYTDLFESAPVGYFTLDRSGAIVQANQAGAALLDSDRERIVGGRFTMFVTEADRAVFNACLLQAYASGQAQACEIGLWRDHGAPLLVSISALATLGGQNCRVVAKDITQRRQIEAALKASEERFRMLWETATDVVVIFDHDNRIQYANPATLPILGYQPDELIGADLALLQPAHLRERHREGLKRYLSTRKRKLNWHAVQTTALHRNGHSLPVEISFSHSQIGDRSLFAGFIRDVSERKAAEVREAAYTQIMTLIATGTPLPEILDAIVRGLEAENPAIIGSIVLLDEDGQHLQIGAGSSLPEFFNRAIQGAAIGPQAGSCGTAIWRNERIIVSNIDTDPLWDNYRQLAAQAELAACWSEPIRSASGKPMGSFALYSRKPGRPGEAELNQLTSAVHLASIAIERKQAEQALMRERDFSNQSLNSLPGTFYVIDQQGRFIRWNDTLEAVSGYSAAEISAMPPTGFFDAADAQRIEAAVTQVFTRGNAQVEAELLSKDGRRIPYYFTGRLIDIDGQPHLIGMGLDVSDRKRTQTDLQESEERYRLLFEHSKDAMMLADPSSEASFISCNRQTLEMFGVPDEASFRRLRVSDMSPPFQPDGQPSAEKAGRMIQTALDQGSHFFEWEHLRLDGTPFLCDVLLTSQIIRGRPMVQATIRDITERRKAEDQLRLAAMVYQHSSEAMMVTDAADRIIAINHAFTQLTDYSEDEIIGCSPAILRAEQDDRSLAHAIQEALRQAGTWQGEVRGRRKNGETFAEWLTINTAYLPSGAVHRRVALFSDISEKKKNEELIWQQANFDFLTGLPNRRMFYDRLGQEIKSSNRSGMSVALMFIDLDRFKEINDTLGPDTGDTLLKDAAQRLRHCVRETDFLCRLGGDEFAIILGALDDPAHIDRIANSILDGMARPFQLGLETAYISASIGISLYPEDGKKLEELLKNADQAMYAAKHLGRNRFSYFTPFMQEAARIRLRLANDLRTALLENQFCIHYQPIVDLASGEMRKAEALIRWNHPSEGMVSPAAFIPIAEETGLIVEIGNWVFAQAAQQAAQWRERHHPSFQISVNKSPVQFRDESSEQTARWLAQLEQLGLPGQSIAVEITEGLLMDAGERNLARFRAFRDAGIQVALDDFGTGYSSLSYLKKFDIDYLKIDQSFTRNLAPGSEDMALVEAIIVMAHKLQLKVVAEGIETESQRQLLQAAGCDFGQGYLFSRPLPAADLDRMLTQQHPISPGQQP